jgi:putative hydrolase of the HAD superfamily
LDYCAQKKYELHLITNGFEEIQQKKINYSGIANYFDVMISSEKAMSPKPNAAIFEYAMKVTNASKEKSLMIGDHFDVDVMGAKNAGMDQVYFNPNKRDDNDGSATYEVACLSELFEIL